MISGKKQLQDDDFPLKANETTLITRDGVLVATAVTALLAEEIVRRLNEDAERRHEGNWSP